MRCLYCGKHLPLFRKLTGGGEFCSDAHRDSYHEEYNRLAVSRLLQAQSRPDEPKVAAKAPVVEHGSTVAVAEEPEVEISGTFLDEFQVFTISPALARAAQFEIEIEPAFETHAEFTLPEIDQNVLGLEKRAGCVVVAPSPRPIETPELDVTPEIVSAIQVQVPDTSDTGFGDQHLPVPGMVPFQFPAYSRHTISRPESAPQTSSDHAPVLPRSPEGLAIGRRLPAARPVPLEIPNFLVARSPAPSEIAEAIDCKTQQVLPELPLTGMDGPYLSAPGTLPLKMPLFSRSVVEPLQLGLNTVEAVTPKPLLPETPKVVQKESEPRRAGRLEIVLTLIGPAEKADLAGTILAAFPELAALQPAYQFEFKVAERDDTEAPVEMEASAEAEASADTQTSVEAAVPAETEVSAEEQPAVSPITPRRVLEELSKMQADRKRTEDPEPPRNREIKLMPIRTVPPGADVLSPGFSSTLFEVKPRLLQYSTQPLRPKVAIGTAAGPLSAQSRGVRVATTAKNGVPEAKHNGSRSGTRSMLHLEDEDRSAAETDVEAPTLFGKLGGLFGKKSRSGKQDAGMK